MQAAECRGAMFRRIWADCSTYIHGSVHAFYQHPFVEFAHRHLQVSCIGVVVLSEKNRGKTENVCNLKTPTEIARSNLIYSLFNHSFFS